MNGKLWLLSIPVVLAVLLLAACGPSAMTRSPGQQAPAPAHTNAPAATPVPGVKTFKQSKNPSLNVTVILPWQGAPMEIRELEFAPPPSNTKRDDLTLIRAIINVEVYDLERKQERLSFRPAMTLVVQYGQEDLKAVGNDASKLVLGFYDLKNEKWKPIPGETVIQRATDTSGTGTIQVTEWGDRHICWATKPK